MKLIYCLLPIFAIVASAAPAFAVAQGKILKIRWGQSMFMVWLRVRVFSLLMRFLRRGLFDRITVD